RSSPATCCAGAATRLAHSRSRCGRTSRAVSATQAALSRRRRPLNFAACFAQIEGPHSMTVSMYKISVPIFVQLLTALSACLDKAAAHAEAKQIDPAFLINMRLAPDMFSLGRQVQQATAHPIRLCSAL